MRNQTPGYLLVERNIRLFVFVVIATLAFVDWVAAVAVALGLLLIATSWNKLVSEKEQSLNHAQAVSVILLLSPLALLSFAISTTGLFTLLVEEGIGGRLPVVFGYGLVIVTCAWFAVKSVYRLNDRLFIALVLVLALLLRLAYALTIDILQVSDFGRMVSLAESIVRNDLSLDSIHPAPTPIYLERVVFYLVPFHVFLPRMEWVIPAANLVFTLGSLWLLHGIARRLFRNPAVARVAIVFAAFIPESIILVLVPSHDVPGAFWMLVNLYLIIRLLQGQFTWRQHAGFVTLLALTLFFAEIQRTAGVFLFVFDAIVVIGAIIASGSASRRIQFVVVFLSSVLLASIATNLFRSVLHEEFSVNGDHRVSVMLAHSEPDTTGSYAYWLENWAERELPPGGGWYAIERMAAGLVLNPFDYTPMLVRKTQRLARLGSQHSFYLHAARWRDHSLDFDERRIIYLTTGSFAPLFWILMFGGLLLTTNGQDYRRLPGFLALVYVMPLLLMMELQPRYMYVIWFLGAPYVAAAFLRLTSNESDLEPVRPLETT